MNWVPTSIQPRVLVSAKHTALVILLGCGVLCQIGEGRTRDYETLELPGGKFQKVPEVKSVFSDKKLKFQATEVQQEKPSVDAKDYVFVKETFVSKKRDDAIRLVRQQLDSGKELDKDNQLLLLGQLYTEKYMELSYLESELYDRQLERYERGGKKGKKPPVLDDKRSKGYLRDAVRIFSKLEKEYPRHPRQDEIKFFIGFVAMEFGQRKKGVRYLNEVIRRFPKSQKFEDAVLYLGDHYFDRNRYRDAFNKYSILASRKNSSLYHYALYKLAWCELNLGPKLKRKSLVDIKRLIEELDGEKSKEKFNLRKQALNDTVVFFTELEAVEDAVSYFNDKLGEEKSLENLKLMASVWLAKAKDKAALKAYRILVDKFGESSEEAPRLQLAIFESQARLGQVKAAVATMSEALERFGSESKWARQFREKKPELAEEILTDLESRAKTAAFFYHRVAQKTRNKNYYDHAFRLYSGLVTHFPKIRERRKFQFYQGEILFAQGKKLAAANTYMRLATSPPKDKLAQEAAYNALLSLDELTVKRKTLTRFTDKQKREGNFKKKSIPKAEKRFLEVATFYLKNYPGHPKAVDVRFRMASIYYQNFHLDEAAKIFQSIAINHPRHKGAPIAANVVLDIYNIKKDFTALKSMAGIFAATKGLGGRGFRREMVRIQNEVQFKEIESLEKRKDWKKAGMAYFTFYKSNPKGALADKALNNAVVNFEKNPTDPQFDRVARLYIKKYPNRPEAKRLLLKLAKEAESRLRFKEAKQKYLQFYRRFPKDKQAKLALFNAAVFSELLDQRREAIRLYDQYLQLKGIPAKDKKAIQLSKIKLYKERNQLTRASQIYVSLIGNAATLQEKAVLRGELLALYRKMGNRSRANVIVSKLRRMNAKSAGAGRSYVVEAKFKALDPERRAYDKLRFRFPPQRLVSDLKRKQKALLRLAAKFDGIVKLGDPDWGVAALSDKAEAYQRFVQAYRAIKIPRQYKGAQRKELQTQLKAIDDEVVLPVEQQSIAIRKECVEQAAKFHVVGRYADRCRAKVKGAIAFTPTGLIPRPSYWTTRWLKEGEGN